jgi:hypothetical protein
LTANKVVISVLEKVMLDAVIAAARSGALDIAKVYTEYTS